MIVRVYRYALLPPTHNVELVVAQLRAARAYRNELVQIERGRRWALRALEDSPEVRDAITAVQAATGSARKEALQVLTKLREETRKSVVARERYSDEIAEREGSCPLYEMERITQLENTMLRGARALTECFWGSYLIAEADHRRARDADLYKDDGLTPHEPRFVHWNGHHRDDPGTGQIGVQIQGGVRTSEALSGNHRWVRLVDGELWLRVGSDGQAPIWARWPIARPHREGKRGRRVLYRAIPDNAIWKKVHVSHRHEGPWEKWSCEITLVIPGEHPREMDAELKGMIAIQACWEMVGSTFVIARWRDDQGQTGIFSLPDRIRTGLPKPDAIRSTRDKLFNEVKVRLAREILMSRDTKPVWLTEAASTLHFWKSQARLHRLLHRWQDEKCDAARPAYEILDEWRMRDCHLYEYETGARSNVLRWRKHWYQTLASQLSSQYLVLLLDDRNLSREARWGESADLRFAASPYELRDALRHAFGRDVAEVPFQATEPNDTRDWCERALAAREAGTICTAREKNESKQLKGGAWARRKAEKAARAMKQASARETRSSSVE